jgi:hypothetical protein
LSDFNNKGFAILDKIHAHEGRRHEVGIGTMNEIKAKLIECGFRLKEYRSEIQDVLVASRVSMSV